MPKSGTGTAHADGTGPGLPVEQVAHLHAQPLGEAIKVKNGDVPQASFDAGHVGPVDGARIGKGLLRQLARATKRSDAVAQAFKVRVRGRQHAPMFGTCGLIDHGLSSTSE